MIQNNDFPNYFIAGDNASLKKQKTYVNLIRWDLILICIGAALSIYNWETTNTKTWIYGISGFSLFVSFVLSLIMKIKKYEDIWYRGRALAESVKTLTWRFMTKSEFFDNNISNEEAKERFIKRIGEIKDKFKDLEKSLKAKDLKLDIITSKMKEIRNSSLQERKDFYLKNRIQNQIDWYESKADVNKEKYEFWFWAVIIAQALSIISIVILIKNPDFEFNFVGLLTTLSASFLSWLQVKKYQENKEAYTTALSELNMIKTLSESITTEEQFSKFVLDSENAMSREHTIWLAQRRM